MKKLLAVVLLVATFSSAAQAAPRAIGSGENLRLDPGSLPPALRANYQVFRVKCVKCHSQERIMRAVQTGIAPISGQPFDAGSVKAYGAKMLRKPESDMSQSDVKATSDLLEYLIAKMER